MRCSVFAFAVLAGIVMGQQKCYDLQGLELDDTYRPCGSGAGHSGCCATNKANHPDICLESGLCMATTNEHVGTIWERGCTDPTGKDPGCNSICSAAPNDSTSQTDSGQTEQVLAWNLQTCDMGTYCCRPASSTKSCCNTPSALHLTTTLGAPQLPTSTPSPLAPSNSTSTPSPTSTSSPEANSANPTNPTDPPIPALAPSSSSLKVTTTTPSPTPPTCPRSRTALIAGLLGAILGTALVATAAALLWTHKREKRQRRLKEHYEAQFEQSWAYRAYRRTVMVEAEARRERERGSVESDGEEEERLSEKGTLVEEGEGDGGREKGV